MPRTVRVSSDPPAAAVYQVGNNEELTVESVSCIFHAISHNPPYGYPIFEWRDTAGGLIYRQQLNLLLNDSVVVSAAAEGEPWYLSNNGQFGFPQATEQQGNASMSIRLPRITLTPGCTFGIFICTLALSFDAKPQDYLDTNHNVELAHLWVEDTGPVQSDLETLVVGPYMLVGGPNA